MRFSLVVAALLLTVPVAAEPDFAFRGQWNVVTDEVPPILVSNYVGVVLIDRERRVTWDSPNDNGKPAKFIGLARLAADSRLEMIMTNRKNVVKIDCLIETSERLRCFVLFSDGRISRYFTLARVGPGPASLAPKR